MARWYIGGLLTHARSILAFAAPTTNSYKRLVPGYEAPVNLVYSQRNRSACVRIPLYSKSPKAKRARVPLPRPVVQPVPRVLGACCMAGLDGIAEPHRAARRRSTRTSTTSRPRSWPRCRRCRARSTRRSTRSRPTSEFLKAGGVFTDDLIDTWIAYKREHEIDEVRLRPHPWEFMLYYDI